MGLSSHLDTKNEHPLIEIRDLVGNPLASFTLVRIGSFTWIPSRDQLMELASKVLAFLETLGHLSDKYEYDDQFAPRSQQAIIREAIDILSNNSLATPQEMQDRDAG